MKTLVAKLVQDALAAMPELQDAVAELDLETTVERTRDPSHGDFATNVAMRLAKAARSNPRELAAKIVDAMPASDDVAKIKQKVSRWIDLGSLLVTLIFLWFGVA